MTQSHQDQSAGWNDNNILSQNTPGVKNTGQAGQIHHWYP